MDNKKGRILIVEDDKVDQMAFERFAKAENLPYDYISAGSVSEASKILEREKFDAVLLDYMLGDGTAFDLFDKMKGSAFIVVTGIGDEEIAVRAMKSGAYDYLTKDAEGNYLKTLPITVENAIKRKREEEELMKYREHLEELVKERTTEMQAEIAERKKAEKALKEAHNKLEKRVEERTAELKAANEELQQEITERKRAEEKQKELYNELKESQAQLIQTEKMSALGKMTAGLAHELNNPMMSILNFIQYCLKHSSVDSRIYSVLQDGESETHRCIDIIQNLLTFSRMEQEGEEAFQKESLAVIFDRVFKILSYQIEEQTISVTQHIAKGTPKIWIRVNNMQQIFLNLISNALDALKKSKRKEIHIDIRREGEFVQVTVADTGCGIAPENLQKIFDPFFTTKSVGEGTGLGLSICQSIIKAHGGKITWESELGKGTKFKIFLAIEKRKYKGETENEKKYSNN